MVLLDLLGRRWALRVLWELRGSPLTFRALRSACGDISPSVLNTRLRELRDVALVMHDADAGFALTAQGRALLETFLPLQAWADQWGRALGRRARAPAGEG